LIGGSRTLAGKSWGKSTKFAKLIGGKIIEILATRCHILKLKCTNFDFGWSSTPDPLGELTALPQTT